MVFSISLTLLRSNILSHSLSPSLSLTPALPLLLHDSEKTGIDGLVARVSGQQTDFGGYLDILCDFVVYAAIPIGLGTNGFFPLKILSALPFCGPSPSLILTLRSHHS